MSAPLPLEGVRVCDFTIVWAGAGATMYLADLGAEVIKVENPHVWNPMTRAAAPVIAPQTSAVLPAWIGGHPNSDPGPAPWNNSPGFIHILRNKKSFTVDSGRPEGLEVVKRLLATCDIVAENLPFGTLEKIGLSDDAIRTVRPDIIILHMPAFGRTGDYVEGRGYGSHMDAIGGGTLLRGYRESSPMTNIQIVPGDFFAGMHGAVAAMAALRHRRRTGEGQVIELTQAESSASMYPQAALDAAWNGRNHRSLGNRSIEGFVPNGVFRTASEDEWIVVSCRDDAEWRALVAYMGSPAWAMEPALSTAAGRAAAEDEIEERISAWTADKERMALFHALQAAGVTAGPVLHSKDAAQDPHLAATGAWAPLPATEFYPATDFNQPPFKFSESDVRLRTAPALFGEHNDYVYREVLRFTDEQVAQFVADGHITDTYAPEITGR